MQEMYELLLKPMNRHLALAGFWLAFQALSFLLYMASMPDFLLLHDLRIGLWEYQAWIAVIALLAALSIAAYEKYTRKRLLYRAVMAMLGIWAAAFIYLVYFVPVVMVGPAIAPHS